MNRINLAVMLVATAIALVLMTVAYFAGVAVASGGGAGQLSLLAQLQQAAPSDLVDRAFRLLRAKYYMPIDAEQEQQLVYGAVEGMLASLREEPFHDEFTHFYDPKLYADLQAQTTGEYAGIGILMGLTADGMYPEIVTVFPATPAEEAGMQPDDVITEIDGEDAFGMILPEVATRIKGEPGTQVKLKLYRPADGQFSDLEIMRREVTYSSVGKREVLADKVGYIEINNFAEDTGKDFRGAVEELLGQGITSLVIDLRNNTGGLVDSAVEVADCFVPEGVIVEVASRDEQPMTLDADPQSKKYKLPLVLLINSNTASASEILTGALKDYGLATVVGEQSFGKGVMQEVIPMEQETVERRRADGSIIKELQAKSAVAITIAQYFTPLHNDIHGKGIEPNVWYNVDNQLQDDAELKRLQEQFDTKVEELRAIRSQITKHVREVNAEKMRAREIAAMLAKGQVVADVPKLETETPEHSPLNAVPPIPGGAGESNSSENGK